MRDLRYALRALRRSPGFALVAIGTLALGIGVNTAVYSTLRGLLWRPPAVAAPGDLAALFSRPAGGDYADFSWADFQDLRGGTAGVFRDLVAYYPVPLSLSEGERNERIWGEFASGGYFGALGLRPALGRLLAPADDASGAEPVLVLSHRAWQRRFASDPAVIGRPVRLNGRPFTVVGVAPAGFGGLYYVGFQPELWLPAHALERVTVAAAGALDRRDGPSFRLMGRLAAGVTVARADAAVRAVAARIAADHPAERAGVGASVLALADARPEPGLAGGFRLAGTAFLVVVGLVLLVACGNVANLLLARSNARQREMALRQALGASRGRLVRQLLVESGVLTAAGALLGVLIAIWAADLLGAALRFPTDIPFEFDLHVDVVVLLYALGAALVTGVAFGLVPALRAADGAIAATLKDGAPAVRSRGRLGGGLVVGQVGVTCVLLVVAGLSLRTLAAIREVRPGFAVEGRLLGTVAPALQQYDAPRTRAFYRALLARVGAVPGVERAALAAPAPLEFSSGGGGVFVEGRAPRADAPGGEPTGWSAVSPGYFDAIGTRLLEGRDLAAADTAGAPRVAVVSRALAERLFPGEHAIGRRLRVGAPDGPAVEIVGIAEDAKSRTLTEAPLPFLYEALDQRGSEQATLVVHAGPADPLALAPALRSALAELDPDMPLADVKTMDQLLSGRALFIPRLAAQGAAILGALALVLAVIGLYGVVSYSVSRRVREMGIRMALGAPRGEVLRLVLRQGLGLTGLGLAAGLPLAAAAALVIRGLLYGVGAADPVTYLGIAVLLTVVTILATLVPAVRATRVDPARALRSE